MFVCLRVVGYPPRPLTRALSSLPHVNANEFITKTRNSQRKSKVTNNTKGVPLVVCKRKEFNHCIGQTYAKFEPIPLASVGWHHKKSKGDYFVINSIKNKEDYVEDWSFDLSGISSELVNGLERQGITQPTNIQARATPILLSRHNALLAAETGCGKTLAYLLPVLHQIVSWRQTAQDRQFNTPLALVVTPSRELAQQIVEVAEQLTENMSINCQLLIGGQTKRAMLNPKFAPVDLLVSTLGALSKLTTAGVYNVDMVRHVVLDEADTLLDDSFIEKLTYFLRKFPFHLKGTEEQESFPRGAQLTLVSATMPAVLPEALEEVVKLESLQKVTTSGLHHFLPHIPQEFFRLGQSSKPNELLKTIKSSKNTPTIVFSNKSSTCDWISMFLNENGINCVNLHGDMHLEIRRGKFEEFQSGRLNVLSCTDIGSRGLDTVRAGLIVNYEFPLHTADYIHRCGRTGRVGSPADCKVVNFVTGGREIQVVQEMEMSARKMTVLPKVNGNIAGVIFKRILKKTQESPT